MPTHIHIHLGTHDAEEDVSYKSHRILQRNSTMGPDGKTRVPSYAVSGPAVKGLKGGFTSVESAKAHIDRVTTVRGRIGLAQDGVSRG